MSKISLIKVVTAVAGLMVASVVSSQASLEMIIDDGAGHSEDIVDNGPGDLAGGTTGEIIWSGSLGVWKMNVDFGLSKPIFNNLGQPEMDLAIPVAMSDGAGTLTITLKDTGFGPLLGSTGVGTIAGGGVLNNGTVSMTGSLNGTQFAGMGPFGTSAFSGSASGNVDGLLSPFSLSETVVINHTSAGYSGGDFDISVVDSPIPEPSTVCAASLLALPFAMWGFQTLRNRRAVKA